MSEKDWTGRLRTILSASLSDTKRTIRFVDGGKESNPVFDVWGGEVAAFAACRSSKVDKFRMASSVRPGVLAWSSVRMRLLALTARYLRCSDCAHSSARLEYALDAATPRFAGPGVFFEFTATLRTHRGM